MAKYCAKCWTFVPQGDVCPRCGNNELTDVEKKPKKAKVKKAQNSLAGGNKTKKSPLVWVALGVCVVLAVVLAVLVLWNVYGYSKGLEYTSLPDRTYAVTGIGSFEGKRLNIPPAYEGKPVTRIVSGAFSDCGSLTQVNIPENITIIDDYAFSECINLKKINVDKDNRHYMSEGGVLFAKDKTKIIAYPAGKKDVAYSIPQGVTSIASLAFYDCGNLTKINIPDSVTEIRESAFSNCNSLTEINIPDSVTSIGDCAFYGCESLTKVNILYGVTNIEYGAFLHCESLTEVNIPDSVTSIGVEAFFCCESLTKVAIPDSVTSIGNRAFSCCDSLTDIYYAGSEEEWDAIAKDNIGTSATVHFGE